MAVSLSAARPWQSHNRRTRAQTFRALSPSFSPYFGECTMTTTSTNEKIQAEALSRAVGNQSLTNWPAIFAGFTAKGIAETDIKPRENIFTYHAWRALGRQVRRGEHGVKVCTWITVKDKTEDATNPD